jgi:NAD(P)H-hydrate epimerase
VIPIVTPDEMKAIDAAAPEPVEVLVERAGAATARAALDLLGGAYGRRVVVVAGKGNNGADGRSAARRLQQRGVRVRVVDAAGAPEVLPPADLVIDAAYGTGFRGDYDAPSPNGAPVLAVDIPSGVDGLTGEACAGGAVHAHRTVTFAALKPGLLLGAGWHRSGRVDVVDIGLDVTSARAHVVEPHDVAGWLPRRRRDGHKYDAAVYLVAGSPGMLGAATLSTHAALRAGAGYVRLASPGVSAGDLPVGEHVGRSLPHGGWASDVAGDLGRYRALAIGPGLGRERETVDAVCELVSRARDIPVVVDGDALFALGDRAAEVIADRAAATILTPHDGEFATLTSAQPGADRFAAARDLAHRTGAVVLLKGSTTIVSSPDGACLVSVAGDERLATAGTGDVLTGVVAAFAARGVPALEAAAGAAVVHGLAGHLGSPHGLVAGDLPPLVASVLSALTGSDPHRAPQHPRS